MDDDHTPSSPSPLTALLQQALLNPRDPAALSALARALHRLGHSGLTPAALTAPPTRPRSDDVFIRDLTGSLVSLSGHALTRRYGAHLCLDRAGDDDFITLCVARDPDHALELLDWIAAQIQAGAALIDLRDAPTRADGDRAWPHP